MKIQPFQKLDLEDLHQLQPHDWSDIRTTISFYLDSDYIFPFKVVINDVLVGTGTAILHEKLAGFRP